MSWWSPPPPSSNSEIFVPLPARALTLVTRACRSLFQRRGSGLQEIFRNPDNALGAWMRSRDCKPFETIPPWIRFGIGISYMRICMSYFPDFIIPKSLEKIFVRGNFAFLSFSFFFFFFFKTGLKGKRWKSSIILVSIRSFFFSFFTRDNKRKEGLPL